MESESVKLSPFDLMTAILKGGGIDLSNSSESGVSIPPSLAMLIENRELLMLLTTSIAVLIGFVVVLVWRRSSQKPARNLEPPKLVIPKNEPEEEVDDGKKKVTIFFGTQTGTAEGFAKVRDFV